MEWLNRWVGTVIGALLMFIAGWYSGRVTSPYYAAHPIVFSDSSAAPDGMQLQALQQLGVREPQMPSPSPSSVAVAGTKTTNLFVGSVNSDKYHHKDCPSARQIKPENQRWFSSAEEAEAAGYSPSQCTREKGENIK